MQFVLKSSARISLTAYCRYQQSFVLISSPCSHSYSSLIQMTLSPCFLRESGKDEICLPKKDSFRPTLQPVLYSTSCLGWELVVVLVGTRTGIHKSTFLSPTKQLIQSPNCRFKGIVPRDFLPPFFFIKLILLGP